MRLLTLSALCLTLLSRASLGQQKVIDVPFDNTTAPGSPFEVTGKVLVQETIAGNEVSSIWEQNVTAKNISVRPIVMLIGIFDAVGPHSSGGYGFRVDKFFTEDVIQPEATIPVARGTNFRGDCCINPLGGPEDPEADFRVQFVQFLDGSTFGDPAAAEDEFARRTSEFHSLRELAKTYAERGELEFQAQLKQAHGPVFIRIRMTDKEQGAVAAITQVRKMIAIGEQRQATLGRLAAQ